MSRKIKNVLSVIFNLIIVVLTYISVTTLFYRGVGGNMEAFGVNGFRYFTIDSNVLLALSSLTLMFSLILKKTPKWVMAFKLMGTVGTTLTFIIVCVFLGPIMGYNIMFNDVNLYMHLITPILGIVSFIFFDPKRGLNNTNMIISIIPVIIYGLVYINEVLITKSWVDFYMLNSGFLEGKWILSFIVMLLISFVISNRLMKWYKKR